MQSTPLNSELNSDAAYPKPLGADRLADPWFEPEPDATNTPTPWHFTPETHALLSPSAPPDGLIPSANDPTLLRLPEHTSEVKRVNSAQVLLQDELKIHALRSGRLAQQLETALTLLTWLNGRH